jgi:hypothetical protein
VCHHDSFQCIRLIGVSESEVRPLKEVEYQVLSIAPTVPNENRLGANDPSLNKDPSKPASSL